MHCGTGRNHCTASEVRSSSYESLCAIAGPHGAEKSLDQDDILEIVKAIQNVELHPSETEP
jgi:hypothetical protein